MEYDLPESDILILTGLVDKNDDAHNGKPLSPINEQLRKIKHHSYGNPTIQFMHHWALSMMGYMAKIGKSPYANVLNKFDCSSVDTIEANPSWRFFDKLRQWADSRIISYESFWSIACDLAIKKNFKKFYVPVIANSPWFLKQIDNVLLERLQETKTHGVNLGIDPTSDPSRWSDIASIEYAPRTTGGETMLKLAGEVGIIATGVLVYLVRCHHKTSKDERGYFITKAAEMQKALGITRNQREKAVKRLVERNYIGELDRTELGRFVKYYKVSSIVVQSVSM